MSGGRRKSKHPQKWEETFSQDELSKLPNIFKNNTVKNELDVTYKAYQCYVSSPDYSFGKNNIIVINIVLIIL